MRHLILILTLVFYNSLFGQQIDGNMEQWDTTFNLYPVSWLSNASYASLPCSPATITAERTTDMNSGNYAVKLEAKECTDDMLAQQVYMGFLAYGDMSNPNLAHGLSYNQRPEQLNFYYKFNRVGTDTAFAKVVLRSLDSTGYAGQIIGQGKISIINNTSTYTLMTVPINYTLPDTPEIIQIVFSTSKTLADQEYFQLHTTPGNGANSGTTLWIDDVTVSGGTLGITENQQNSFGKIHPNPFQKSATITFENSINENATLKIYDSQGRPVKIFSRIKENQLILERGNLNSGLYFYQLETDKQLLSTGKFIIE